MDQVRRHYRFTEFPCLRQKQRRSWNVRIGYSPQHRDGNSRRVSSDPTFLTFEAKWRLPNKTDDFRFVRHVSLLEAFVAHARKTPNNRHFLLNVYYTMEITWSEVVVACSLVNVPSIFISTVIRYPSPLSRTSTKRNYVTSEYLLITLITYIYIHGCFMFILLSIVIVCA